ncbi:hypothetical protein Fluta_3858 [Fluviicola taffensis DSM 16823]|uniref:Secretion system C-terminal sorting domain-containing protein n=2 Tax=Fluviicola TaxID=332102 RepID=F2IH10_FLUTR|nr:hypothetical protein Fluta_3858 [Fluviicola taffensis DSM 16823]
MKKTLLAISLGFYLSPLFGQNWTGAINSDWNNTANWSTTPSNGDDITIDPVNYSGVMAQPIIHVNSTFTPAEMLVQNGAQLTISATLNTTDRVEILGAGTIVTLTNSGTFSLIGGGNNARLIFAEDAHLEMNGGILSSGQRLLFELGGTGTINSGTVTVGETIALVDGSALGSSKLTQNGGTITTNAEFGFENEAGIFYPTFEQNGGVIQINGSLLWLGAAPGAGKGYFRSTGGSVFVTGTIGNDPTSTMGMYLELDGVSVNLENSGAAVNLLLGDSIVLKNQSTWKDLNSVLWQNNGVVQGQDSSFFQSGNTSINGSGSYQLANVNVPLGKIFNHISPVSLRINGNISISGIFNSNGNTVVLNGIKNQVVNHTLNNLILGGLIVENKANGPADGGFGVSLNTNLSLSSLLELNDGIIVSGSNVLIELADNLALSGQSDSTFIAGYVEKTGNDSFEFPLGFIPDKYRPLSISAPSSISSQIKVGYISSAYPTLNPLENPLQSISVFEYWDFTNSINSDLLSASIGWNNASQSGLTNCTDISLSVWDGTKWAFTPSNTSGLCNGSNEGTLFSTTTLPANGPITIGFTSNVTQQTIHLCAGDSVTVGTNTYSVSGTYFDVLEDINGDDSTVVSVISVSNPIIAAITDNVTSITVNAPTATSINWINCTDGTAAIGSGNNALTFTPSTNGIYAVIAANNSCVDTSSCIVIDQLGLSELSKNEIRIFPNPVANGASIKLVSNSTNFVIQSLDGKIIQPITIVLLDGKCEVELPILESGIYLLTEYYGMKNPKTSRFRVN